MKLEVENSYEFEDQWQPKCPHCGDSYEVSDEGDLYQDGNETQLICSDCGKEYNVTVEVRTSYYTGEDQNPDLIEDE